MFLLCMLGELVQKVEKANKPVLIYGGALIKKFMVPVW